jgi:hypothetical protein
MHIIETRNDLLDLLPKNLIVAELGVFKGEFSEEILARMNPSKLHLVDLFPAEMCSGDKDGNNMVHADLSLVYEQLINKYKDDAKVVLLRSTTSEFLNGLSDHCLDAVYIDADHTYEGVTKDLDLSLVKVKNGGIIMGHDYCRRFEGVMQAVDEFCQKNNRKISYITKDGCPTYLIYNLS